MDPELFDRGGLHAGPRRPDGDLLTKAVATLGLLADRVAVVESAITRAADPRHLMANPAARHAARPSLAREH